MGTAAREPLRLRLADGELVGEGVGPVVLPRERRRRGNDQRRVSRSRSGQAVHEEELIQTVADHADQKESDHITPRQRDFAATAPAHWLAPAGDKGWRDRAAHDFDPVVAPPSERSSATRSWMRSVVEAITTKLIPQITAIVNRRKSVIPNG